MPTDSSRSFTLDKRNAKLMGVCAGLATHTGVDALLVRVMAVLLTLCLAGPVMIVAYLLAGWFANAGPR